MVGRVRSHDGRTLNSAGAAANAVSCCFSGASSWGAMTGAAATLAAGGGNRCKYAVVPMIAMY